MIQRYNNEQMAEIWSEKTKYQLWANIELTHLSVVKPKFPILNILISDRHVSAIKRIEKHCKHDVAAFVEWLEQKLMRNSSDARYIHYGLTSSDIVDTAFTLQLMSANHLLKSLSQNLIDLFKEQIKTYGSYKILGRTHGQAAEPINLGDKLYRYKELINQSIPNLPYYGRMAGSVGAYRYLSKPKADLILKRLHLESGYMDGQVINRAYYARHMNAWTILASVLEKIATDYRLLAQSEVKELREWTSSDQIGSSSMPHKCNPCGFENICGIARVIRGYNTTEMENIALWHERDISHSSAERIIYPDASILLAYMLVKVSSLIRNVHYNCDMMETNLKNFGTKIDSQKKLLKLIENGMSRKEAHKSLR